MLYMETLEDQNARMSEHLAQVKEYLDRLADAAEMEREHEHRLPDGMTPEHYFGHIKQFRPVVQEMLGYPPPGTRVESDPVVQEIGRDEDDVFYRVNIQLLEEGLNAYGLLIKPHAPEKTLAVAIHGAMGTPEMAAGILGRNNYNDMGRRLARRGHTVWMPACYERTSFDSNANHTSVRRSLDLRSRIVGTTLNAIEAFTIITSTEVLLATEHQESNGAIAVGLSYGGFRALEACALSDSFIACLSSCYFNDRRSILTTHAETGKFDDWFLPNVLRVATDVELCMLVCPRPLFIEVGARDEHFPAAGAIGASSDVRKLYESLGIGDRFEFSVFDGGHEFSGQAGFDFLARLGM